MRTIEHDDRNDCVCSSSSADSITSSKSDKDRYIEEVIDDEGESELILVPRKEVRKRDSYTAIKFYD